MRIIDEQTQQEISAADLTKGFTVAGTWASPEAYASIDNITKFALADDDYEDVLIYHEYTPEELAKHTREVLEQQLNEANEQLTEAIEAFFSCSSLTDFLKLLTNQNNRSLATRRKELRERLAKLKQGDE